MSNRINNSANNRVNIAFYKFRIKTVLFKIMYYVQIFLQSFFCFFFIRKKKPAPYLINGAKSICDCSSINYYPSFALFSNRCPITASFSNLTDDLSITRRTWISIDYCSIRLDMLRLILETSYIHSAITALSVCLLLYFPVSG